MLRDGQKAYLSKLSKERLAQLVELHPYDPKVAALATVIINKIKQLLPEADVRFMGASALGISGQNDIDIYIITPNQLENLYIEKLETIFGEWSGKKWKWQENGIDISVYIQNPDDYKLQEHLALFKVLSTNPAVLKEYESIKLSMNGKPYRDYQIAKYEFYNRVLGF